MVDEVVPGSLAPEVEVSDPYWPADVDPALGLEAAPSVLLPPMDELLVAALFEAAPVLLPYAGLEPVAVEPVVVEPVVEEPEALPVVV